MKTKNRDEKTALKPHKKSENIAVKKNSQQR